MTGLDQNSENGLDSRSCKKEKDVLGRLLESRVALADAAHESLDRKLFYRFSDDELEIPRSIDDIDFKKYKRKMGDTLAIPDESIKNSQENSEQLVQEFIELRELELAPVKTEAEQARLEELIKKFKSSLGKNSGKKYRKAHNMFFRLVREGNLSQRVMAALPEEQAKAYLSDLKAIRRDYERGKISQLKYLSFREEINAKVINSIGDKELKKTFVSYKEQNESSETLWDVEVAASASSEGYIEDVQEVTDVLTIEEIKKYGFDFEVQSDGSAIVNVGSDAGNNFPVSVSVAQLEDGEYVYYLNDDYTNFPVRVEASHLSEALDLRHVDSYFSHEISPYLTDVDSVNNIPNQEIARVIYFLIGNGKERGYAITGDDKFVLDNLVSVLIVDDDKYPGLDKKIDFLNNFITGKEKGASVRRFLLNSSSDIVFPISELGERIE